MAGPPVYGVAMCTVQGIRNVLAAVHGSQPAEGPHKVRGAVRAAEASSRGRPSQRRACRLRLAVHVSQARARRQTRPA
jgi:hypothetical protein